MVGVASPSFISCTPLMSCRIVPVLNRLDQDPREEEDDDIDGAAFKMLGEAEGRRGHTGDFRLSRSDLLLAILK